MNILKHKSFVAIAVVMSFVMFATPILAQQGEMMAGRMAGEMAARSEVNSTMWMAIGCIGGLLGVIIAYVYEPSPSATQLLGKSPEYVASYSDAYKSVAKRTQASKAWIGCVASAVLWVVYAVVVVAAADTTNTVY